MKRPDLKELFDAHFHGDSQPFQCDVCGVIIHRTFSKDMGPDLCPDCKLKRDDPEQWAKGKNLII